MNRLIHKKVALFTACFIVLLQSAVHCQITYSHRFNPEQGMVNASEEPFRREICLNGSWKFMPVFSEDTVDTGFPETFQWDNTAIRIPSPWNVNGFTNEKNADFKDFPSYPKKWEEATQAWMEKDFTLPADWKNQRILLHFEAVAGKAVYYLNGQQIGENFDIFLPYEMDVTNKVKSEGKNVLLVKVMASKLFNLDGKYGHRPYVSGSFWGTYISGIWQDVYLEGKPQTNISGVFVRPDLLHQQFNVDVTISNRSATSQTLEVSGNVNKWNNLAGAGINDAPSEKGELEKRVTLKLGDSKPLTIAAYATVTITLSRKADSLAQWTPEHPDLYGLVLHLTKNGEDVDRKYQRFGWRQYTFSKDTLELNGRPFHLKGDSWHFMGVPQMTRRYAWGWFQMLKQANANAVRLHAEPFPHFYLDVADEMGICVLDETGIWASDGGPDMASDTYWKNAGIQVEHLVLRDRNHPSVFGWSVCNETMPVAQFVFHAPDVIVQRLLQEINNWVGIVKKLDPTRPWISGDGETNFATNLPTIVGHYGDVNAMKHWSEQGKPWGIGEQGMAYYGTTAQVAVYNNNRAYESQQGRMEGLADEAYKLIGEQRQLNASYTSVFNLVWYSLKPLALGMKDITRPTTSNDGIFFTSFEEGVAGMQPERLGPYTTTLNPGYDPSLPLFETWPLFDAVKAANATPIGKFSISKDSESVPVNLTDFHPIQRSVLFLSPASSPLLAKLKELGVILHKNDGHQSPQKVLILLDGKMPPAGRDTLNSIKEIMAGGGNMLVLGVCAESLARLNRIVPAQLVLTNRICTSFIKKINEPALSGLGNADFYFTELIKAPVMLHGLSGDFVSGGRVLLSASNTDWSMWNNKPEYDKTANVLKSEREYKEGGAALVRYTVKDADYYISSLETDSLKDNANNLLIQILANLGASFMRSAEGPQAVLSPDGYVKSALVCGPFNVAGMSPEEMSKHDFLGNESTIQPGISQKNGDNFWQVRQADSLLHSFDLSGMSLKNQNENAVAYLSFWLYSPRSLANLLTEPDMPVLNMYLDADGGASVLLNGKVLLPFSPGHTKNTEIKSLPLAKGWNNLLIKVVKKGKVWSAGVHFKSDNRVFMQKLRSALTN